jgi:hypothetical protein
MGVDALAGLRNLRTAFLTGALLLGSLYVIFGPNGTSKWHLRHTADDITHLWKYMPVAIFALACTLIGSLYTTGLEGIVDWLHRHYLKHNGVNPKTSYLHRQFLRIVAPLSESARTRLTFEAGYFYDECEALVVANPSILVPWTGREAFIRDVFADVLWLEGKLVGTSLQEAYNQYRAEGELRLSTAILVPLIAFATCRAFNFDGWQITIVMVLAVILTIKLIDYGLYYFRRAHSFLAHHIADGAILTPSMETLKRATA